MKQILPPPMDRMPVPNVSRLPDVGQLVGWDNEWVEASKVETTERLDHVGTVRPGKRT